MLALQHCLKEVRAAQSSAPSSNPASEMTTVFWGAPLDDPTASTFCTTSKPSMTLPNTTCRPSSQDVFTVQMKNCDPLVFGPAFAMLKVPGPSCFSLKFSSANLAP